MKNVLTLLILLQSIHLLHSQTELCIVIDERSGIVYRVNQDGSQQAPISQIVLDSVEAIAWNGEELWLFDAATMAFYTLDPATGTTTYEWAAPSYVENNTGNTHQIEDVDGLSFSPIDPTVLWGVERISGPTNEDYLFAFDITTGQIFNGLGYPITGVFDDIDDIAVNPPPSSRPIDGISNNDGAGDVLVSMSPFGTGIVIGPLVDAAGIQINDMEGLSFAEDGNLIGVTGDQSTTPGSLYSIDKNTGIASLLAVIDAPCPDFESIVCFETDVDFMDMSSTVEEVPCDEAIPTMSEWGLMICGLLMLIIGVTVRKSGQRESLTIESFENNYV